VRQSVRSSVQRREGGVSPVRYLIKNSVSVKFPG
jgi:hypothetical protein